jgi:ribosome-associated heat shock protein Hsp15
MASDACNGGKVKVDGVSCKPSRDIKTGETISIKMNGIERIVKVKSLLDKRVAAPLVPDFCTDLTPTAEFEKLKMLRTKFEFRDPGTGRPTKKDYRDIEQLKWYLDDEDTDEEDEQRYD